LTHYANITIDGPSQEQLVAALKQQHVSAYVSPAVRGRTVIFHEDLSGQEQTAGWLSSQFNCPALLIMGVSGVLLYHLYEKGEQTDAYVSSPHDELELGEAPPGDASTLCSAFGADHAVRRVEQILQKTASPAHPYALAINRHGELFRALGLPLFAAGGSFQAIELGELPEGAHWDASRLLRVS
jgi:hypothetical protein